VWYASFHEAGEFSKKDVKYSLDLKRTLGLNTLLFHDCRKCRKATLCTVIL
jgi:hypothetical protein